MITYKVGAFEIMKTQGTRNSVGSFMVYAPDMDDYLTDKDGNNSFDTYEEALSLIKDTPSVKNDIKLWMEQASEITRKENKKEVA